MHNIYLAVNVAIQNTIQNNTASSYIFMWEVVHFVN